MAIQHNCRKNVMIRNDKKSQPFPHLIVFWNSGTRLPFVSLPLLFSLKFAEPNCWLALGLFGRTLISTDIVDLKHVFRSYTGLRCVRFHLFSLFWGDFRCFSLKIGFSILQLHWIRQQFQLTIVVIHYLPQLNSGYNISTYIDSY